MSLLLLLQPQDPPVVVPGSGVYVHMLPPLNGIELSAANNPKEIASALTSGGIVSYKAGGVLLNDQARAGKIISVVDSGVQV